MTQDEKENNVNKSCIGQFLSPHSPGTNPALPLKSSATPKSPQSFEIQVPALLAVTVRELLARACPILGT